MTVGRPSTNLSTASGSREAHDPLSGGLASITSRTFVSKTSFEKGLSTKPHWYLFTLGTAPERQGKGVGSALLRSMLRRVDERGEPAHLESSKERNVPRYSRFGFEVIDVLAPTSGRAWR